MLISWCRGPSRRGPSPGERSRSELLDMQPRIPFHSFGAARGRDRRPRRCGSQRGMPTDDAALHPRPQLRRRRWTDLCGAWGFAYDDADVGLQQRWHERDDVFDREIQVPFPPESPASGIGDTARHPVAWYRRGFTLAPDDRAGGLLLHFGAVDYAATVWVNGHRVAEHRGGQTPFAVDIAGSLVDGDQVVV